MCKMLIIIGTGKSLEYNATKVICFAVTST